MLEALLDPGRQQETRWRGPYSLSLSYFYICVNLYKSLVLYISSSDVLRENSKISGAESQRRVNHNWVLEVCSLPHSFRSCGICFPHAPTAWGFALSPRPLGSQRLCRWGQCEEDRVLSKPISLWSPSGHWSQSEASFDPKLAFPLTPRNTWVGQKAGWGCEGQFRVGMQEGLKIFLLLLFPGFETRRDQKAGGERKRSRKCLRTRQERTQGSYETSRQG